MMHDMIQPWIMDEFEFLLFETLIILHFYGKKIDFYYFWTVSTVNSKIL